MNQPDGMLDATGALECGVEPALAAAPPLALAQSERAALAWCVLGVVAWWTLTGLLHPDVIVDELDHYAVIRELRHGSSPLALEMPMPLTYHWLVRAVLWPWEPPLWSARALSGLLSCAGLWAMAAAIRRENARSAPALGQPGPSLWHWAYLPIAFPYAALVYTEPLALSCVALALYARAGAQTWLAAAAMLASCLVRQSHVVWLGFFGVWELIERWPTLGEGRARAIGALRASAPYLLGAALMAGLFVSRGSLSFSNLPENGAGFNPGQFCLLGLFVLLLWAPLWVLRAPLAREALVRALRARPVPWALGLGLGTGLSAWGAVCFTNLNEWNWLPEFVGNWPLIWMDRHPTVAFAVMVGAVVALGLTLWCGRAQAQRLLLGGVLVFTLVYLAPQNLIDPRYFVVPVLLAHWFWRFSLRESRWLSVWYVALSVGMVLVVLRGGMW
jgi:hypothetical protein